MFGLFGLPQGVTQGAATLAMQKPQEAPRKPGFSEPGGLGEKLALLGGAISNLGGRRNPLAEFAMQQMMQRQQMQAQSQRDQAQADAENRQWYERKQWERDNPMPTAPYRWESNDGSLMELGQGGPRVVYRDPTPKINYQRVNNPDGTFTMVPIPMTGAAPQAPVGKLTPIGGGAPQGPVPFAGSPPQSLQNGSMTSGRRTVEGNRMVGGVPNSKHLTGEAADWAGPDLNALLGEVRKLPGLRRAFIHNGNHVHGEGNWNVPYFGKRGTTGKR